MIDGRVMRAVAEALAGNGGGESPVAIDELKQLAATCEPLVVAHSRLEPRHALPVPELVGRREWIEVNATAMGKLLEPLGARLGNGLGPAAGAMRGVVGVAAGAQTGALLGLMSQRVLGQYEHSLIDEHATPRLLFVGANLAEGAARLEADAREFVTWVTLHELTHAVQFAGVPWLHGHLAGLARLLVDELTVDVDVQRMMRLPSAADVRKLADAVLAGDIVGLVATPAQRELIDRLQTTMAVIEGHAEHVMDTAGAELLPSLPELRAGMAARRKEGSGLWRLVARLLGIEMKMRQYDQGGRFCAAVVEQAGEEGLARVWSEPGSLPSPVELLRPADWVARVAPTS